MRAERRGRVALVCWRVNRRSGGAGEQTEAETVRHLEGGGLGGIPEGQGEQGSGRCRRGVDRGVREEPQGEPLQALESDVLGELLPTAGPNGGDTQARRTRGPDSWRAHGGGQDRPDGREDVPGAEGGAG